LYETSRIEVEPLSDTQQLQPQSALHVLQGRNPFSPLGIRGAETIRPLIDSVFSMERSALEPQEEH
jgi:hypothetical protein